MKKSLLLLFSLLIFVGNVWGECYVLNSAAENSIFVIDEVVYDLDTNKGEAYQLTYDAKCEPWGWPIKFWDGDLYAAQYVDGQWEDIYNEKPPKSSYKSYGPINLKSTATKVKLYTKTGATGYKYFKNVKVTQKKYLTITSTTSHDFENVVYGSSSEAWTVNYKYSSTSCNVSSNSSAFIVSQSTAGNATCGKSGTGSFTITFKPTQIGEQSGTITVGSATISVSGVGTPQVPSNLNATEEYLQSTLSWSGAEGSYYQVYSGNTLLYKGTNNSYLWTGLQWGTPYSFKVQACSAENTNCSDFATKDFNTKTLQAPTGVTVSNVSYDNATVTWNAADGASLYRVYLSSDNGQTYTKYGNDVMNTSARQMQITELVPGKKYYVKVESVLNNKETSRTDSKDFTTKAINVPQNLTCTPDYLSATLTWSPVEDKSSYGVIKDGIKYYYAVYKDNVWVADTQSEQYTIENLQWGDNNCGSYTVKTYAFNTTSEPSAARTVTTKELLTPTGVTVSNTGFDNATLTWTAATGATSYVLYLGSTKIDEVEASVTSYTFENLELDTNYSIKVESKLNDKETSSAVAQSVKTGNLNASASFTISDASYTTCHGSWSAIPNATGYKVVASNGAVTIFDGGNTTSGIIAGLLPNNTYTCTIYGMYNNAVSKNGKESNEISTLETNCESQSYTGSVTMGDATWGGFNWDAKPSATFQTTKNQATVTFSYETSSKVATHKNTDYFFTLEESKDGTKNSWRRVGDWSSSSRKSSSSVTLSRGYQYFRFVYYGNFAATIYGVSAVQAVYMEVDKTNINFGNLVYGNSASATINVAYSTMVSEITTTNSNYTLSPASVGYDDCRYGTIPVEVTFNANGTAPLGEQNTLIYIGSNPINVYATVTLPVPVLSLVSASYQSVDLSWEAIPGAEKYKVNCSNGTSAWIKSSDFTGTYTYGGLLQNTEYTFTVQAYGGEELTDESNAVTTTTLSLAAPTIAASNISYGSATLTWSVVDDAADYELYDVRTGKSYIFAKGTNSVAIDTLSLHTSYTYRIYSRLADETRSLTYGSVTFNTLDLAASTSFELSNISYNAMDAAWDAVEGATGYMIRERWTKMVLTFDSNVTSTTIYGLKPGTYYEFYLYATYNDVQATDSNRISATGTTLGINCPVQVVDDHTFGCSDIGDCGFDWSDKIYEITTEKNAPVLSFAFEINKWATKSAEEMTKYGPHIRVEEYTGGQWIEKWRFTRSEGSYSGSANVDNLERSTRKVRIIYKGNLDCKVTDCTISQSSYFELNKSSVPFGECYIGTPSVTQTVSADYSSQAASVVSTDTGLFTVSKETLGNGDCGYGTDEVIITANTALEPGTYNADLSVGRNTLLPMSITILGLPAPTPFEVSGTAPASITLTWGDVNITETGYKVVCKQGETEIETKNLGGDVTTCTFEGLTPNVEYTFTITTMYNTIENGSATITGSTANVPAPQNFEISNIMSARADASWSTVTGATGYRLSWDNGGSEGNGSVDLDADVTNYTLTGLIPGTTYTATVTSLFGGTAYGSVDTEFTTTFVVRTSASGDEPANQQHNIEFISGELAGDGSYKAGAVIRYTTSTTSANIRFVSVNVDGIIYNTPEVEIVINSNVHIESYYVYNGIAEVVDEHGEVIYGTLTDAVNAAEEGAVINLLGDVAQDMVVSKYIKFNGNGHDIDNLYINKDGNVELTGAVTVVKDFGLEVSAARSGQFLENGGKIEVTGKAYVDKTFDASGTSKATTWYSLAVPFPVSVANGMFILANSTEKAAKAFSDINIYHYDGAVRAQTISGRPSDDAWVPVTNGYLQPGVFYLVAIPKGGANTFRFYKAEGEDLITLSKNVDLYEYHAQNPIHGGWNGIGNSQLYHVGVTFNSTGYAQILDTNNKFVTVDLGESSFAVTTPMFIQSAEDATATFSFKNNGKLRSASAGSATYNLRIAREGANEFADQMFVSASSEATGSYTIGKDLAKFEVSTAYPQIYTSAYNVSLSVHEAAYNEKNIADMPLYIYIPEAGNYTLSLGKDVLDGTTLYLVKDGVEIHNFNTDGAYTLYLAKGKNTSYSLRIAGSEIEDVPTPAAETEANGTVKVYVKEHTLYIEGLAEGETYTVGNMIRSLYSGKSNGNIVRLPLDQQGVYWVKAGEKGVKVLNK